MLNTSRSTELSKSCPNTQAQMPASLMLWQINFLSQLQCCTASTGACLGPLAPQWTCRVSQTARHKFTPWIQKQMALSLEQSTRLAPLLPSCALTWRFRQKPGGRKPTLKSVFYLDILGPIMASVLQRTILGRICLLISEEKRNHLPNMSSMYIFLRGRKAENMNIPSTRVVITWAVLARKYLSHEGRAMPCCPTRPQVALGEDCWGSVLKSWTRTHWAPWWTSSSSQSTPWQGSCQGGTFLPF